MTASDTRTPASPSAGPDSPVDRISDEHVRGIAALSPITAVLSGIPTDHPGLDDLSPDGLAARRELAASSLAAVTAAPAHGPDEELARSVLVEQLQAELELHASGWLAADLNTIASPLQDLRTVFDLLPTATQDDRAAYLRRLQAVPAALAGYRSRLRAGAADGRVAAVRQVDRCAEQCRDYGGSADLPGYFRTTVATVTGRTDGPAGAGAAGRSGGAGSAALARELAAAALAADAAYEEFGGFLSTELRPLAPAVDAVGPERYRLAARQFLGADLDPLESYEWGLAEFRRIERELREHAAALTGGGSAAEAAAQLDADPHYRILGADALQAWMQQRSDTAIAELAGTWFDIPGPVRELRCRIAPPGGALGAYYIGPSDDFSRPGSMWWSVDPAQPTFASWREASVVAHEGVPGHHLQIATAVAQRSRLNTFRRLLASTSGHCEGWALYAEQLVREVGGFDDRGELLGLLDSQLFRAARVVLDIGMHLQLPLPDDVAAELAPGATTAERRWTPETGLAFLRSRTLITHDYSRDEIDRYLGWPGQSPSYKLGERVWSAGRASAMARHGAAFDPVAFHTAALQMGGMGLRTLAVQLAGL